MTLRIRGPLAAWFTATLLATAMDLGLSAANGYVLRIDRALLFLWDSAGLGIAAAAVLAAITLARATLRRLVSIPPMPAAECLAAGLVPVGLYTLKRHPELAVIVVFAAGALLIVVAALMEGWWRIRIVRPGLAFVALCVCAGGIIASIHVPLLGRDMIAPVGPRATPAPVGPNLVMIVLDTLRADRVGAYGYSRPLTPWLDEFSKGATVYERAIASSSYTLPTHATIFTGLYAESHGAIENDREGTVSLVELGLLPDHANVSPLSDEAKTLAEMMQEKGYETAAICANAAYLSRVFNMDQGFQTYVDATGSRAAWQPAGLYLALRLPMPQKWRLHRMVGSNERYYRFANEINALTFEWMEGRKDRPFFLFLNYMEPHAPHFAMPGYRDLFPKSYELLTADWGKVNRGEESFSDEQKSILIDAYDAQVRYLDDELRILFARLKQAGALENTVVVICADHGDAFYEHGTLGHAMSVYEPEVWVPLIIKRADQTQGERVARFVGMTDVLPTVLRALGMPVPLDLDGVDLSLEERALPIMSTFGRYERDYSEYAVYSDPWKLLWRSDRGPQLFQIRDDGGETVDRAAEQPEIVARLLSLLETYHQRPGKRLAGGELVMDDETRERLEAVGYVDADH